MTANTIQHFLVIYNIDKGKADVEPFGKDYSGAVKAYAAAERRFGGEKNIEVVLLGSDSFETLERTHSSYFELGRRHADSIVRRQLADLGLV